MSRFDPFGLRKRMTPAARAAEREKRRAELRAIVERPGPCRKPGATVAIWKGERYKAQEELKQIAREEAEEDEG